MHFHLNIFIYCAYIHLNNTSSQLLIYTRSFTFARLFLFKIKLPSRISIVSNFNGTARNSLHSMIVERKTMSRLPPQVVRTAQRKAFSGFPLSLSLSVFGVYSYRCIDQRDRRPTMVHAYAPGNWLQFKTSRGHGLITIPGILANLDQLDVMAGLRRVAHAC